MRWRRIAAARAADPDWPPLFSLLFQRKTAARSMSVAESLTFRQSSSGITAAIPADIRCNSNNNSKSNVHKFADPLRQQRMASTIKSIHHCDGSLFPHMIMAFSGSRAGRQPNFLPSLHAGSIRENTKNFQQIRAQVEYLTDRNIAVSEFHGGRSTAPASVYRNHHGGWSSGWCGLLSGLIADGNAIRIGQGRTESAKANASGRTLGLGCG